MIRLLEMDGIERTRAAAEKVAKILKKHPATIYRWIESYNCSGRLSELLRKSGVSHHDSSEYAKSLLRGMLNICESGIFRKAPATF